jgi:hypothetical protein
VIRPGPAEVAPCRSRALAAWLAVIGGVLGAHRFYLHGRRDRVGWLAWPPTVAGLVGLWRLRTVGADDGLALLLLPLLGLSIAAAMAAAIVIALTSDEQWATRFGGPVRPSGWIPVLAAIVALLLGAPPSWVDAWRYTARPGRGRASWRRSRRRRKPPVGLLALL